MSRLQIEKHATVWIAKFNNPPHGYMDDDTTAALVDLLAAVEDDASVRVVVFSGSQADVFIRHFDVGVLLQRGTELAHRGLSFSLDRPVPETALHRCLRRMETMPVVFIAALNGSAMGGGLEFALACDIRLVQQGNYDFGLPEINLGLLAGAGGTQRLARLIGESRALELCLLGRTLSPDEAVAYGIAAECVEGDVLARSLQLAATLAAKSAPAVAHIKHLIRGAGDRDLDDGLAEERTLFCDLMVSDQALQRMAQFETGGRDIQRVRDDDSA